MLIAAAFVLGWFTFVANPTIQDDPTRWESTIQEFEASETESPVPAEACLFVGSSSIRLWDLDAHFPDHATINRGFGGSETSDVNHYFDRLVARHAPSVIIVYAGDNDIANEESAEQVAADYRTFFDRVREELPEAHVIYLPIKPSLARWEMWPEMQKANHLVRDITTENYRWHYVDLPAVMLGNDRQPIPELFVDDGLHLSEIGYALWTKEVQRELDHALQTQSLSMAQGRVFHDKNHNGRFDSTDAVRTGVKVSNGRDIVTTDTDGKYALPIDDDDIVFVIKPRGWRTALNQQFLPHFYYIHKPNGSPESRFEGVAPTGPLPDSIDFPLYPQTEPDQFKAIFFGDPQPRNHTEVNYVANDVVAELVGTDASFGVTLGDIAFDNLETFESQNQAIALIGIPWYNVIGNHDVNRESPIDVFSDETFERYYGPAYYSFDYGPTHFIVIDNIDWYTNEENGSTTYRAGMGTDQLRFIRDDLARIEDDQLVVLMMHIPIVSMHDRFDLYRIIESRPFSMSISGHTHHHEHRFLDNADGWRGDKPHHHVINVTVSGSWWAGAPDDRGIPHAMMADGAPNGYSIVSFDGHDYRLNFKAAGRPADYQMRITAPESIEHSALAQTNVFVNVFNGSERTTVEMQIGSGGEWLPLDYTREHDPYFTEFSSRENAIEGKSWRDLPAPKMCPHLWKQTLPAELEIGSHLLSVRATDPDGTVYQSRRVIRIVE